VKLIAFFITGVLSMTSAADAAPRPAVEHYGAPMLNGQRLPFSSAVRVGDILYLSGAIGRGPDGRPPEGIEAQTKATMDDIGATLKLAGLSHHDLFHCTVFLSDMANWAAFNRVRSPPAARLESTGWRWERCSSSNARLTPASSSVSGQALAIQLALLRGKQCADSMMHFGADLAPLRNELVAGQRWRGRQQKRENPLVALL
jgi:enamine deaminase RidA (YjgF/YER057c/UK114 family)